MSLTSTGSRPELIPPEIGEAYYSRGIARSELITGGHINTTLLVTDTDGEQSILQRLNHATSNSMAEDYQTVSSHLQMSGWEMAQIRQAQDGASCLPDSSGKIWRSFTYIESEPASDLETDIEANIILYGLLGRLHKDLSGLDYEPRTAVSPYRDVRHFMERLAQLTPEMSKTATREFAKDVTAAAKENTIEDTSVQLVHGDPRMANTLCRQGKPFTFIDWDGLVMASPLFDLGDLISSSVSRLIFVPDQNFSRSTLQTMLKTYSDEAEIKTSEEDFTHTALSAGKSVALCLGMRCLIDSVEDYYFGWEASGFGSRKEFNLYRAERQWQVYKALCA